MLLKNAHILVVDDDPDVLTALRLLLKPKTKEVRTENNPNNLLDLLQKHQFDIVLLDMNFNGLIHTGNEGIFWLNKIKEKGSAAQVVLITAYGDIDLAVRSLKEGASDFILKPWKNEKLLESLEILVKKRHKTAKKRAKKELGTIEIIGESEAMEAVFTKIQKVAPTDANVLILGENGTGKDLIAQAIHENSARKEQPFVKVDVGALTASLFESELFGYKKGAFTDAREDRKGRFEAAQGGTLFLDEIGNISLHQQARLLTVLQNREITPLGANETVAVDIRLICATNLPISTLADEHQFRKDLIYRINTIDITVPPLRERKSDISLLTEYFVEMYAEKYAKGPFRLEKPFFKKLEAHSFPGNVRELQYALERAVIMAEKDSLSESDLVFSTLEKQPEISGPRTFKLEMLEKNTILKVIEKNKGNISKSAKELGITRAALYRRLEKHGL